MPVNDGTKIERRISYYVVLFLDLLGQKDEITKLEDLQARADDEAAYRLKFGTAAGRVWGIRGCLASRIEACLHDAPLNEQGAPKIKLQTFSDTVIAYFAFDKENPGCFLALHAILLATAETMVRSLASKMAIRGGLDFHLATDLSDQPANPNTVASGGDLWGPAPKRAYELAEKLAEYPRILIGDGIPEMVRALGNSMKEKLQGQPAMARSMYYPIAVGSGTKYLVAKDPNDGKLILDYLNPGLRERYQQGFAEILAKAAQFAVAEHKRFSECGNRKLAERYRQLLQYMELRQEPNGVLPANSIPVITAAGQRATAEQLRSAESGTTP